EDTSAKMNKATTGPATKPSLSSASAPNRYMSVFVEYDPALQNLPKPAPTTGPTSQATTKPAPTTQQIADGKKSAQDKMARFGKFFYVISDESFKKLRPPADTLFESTAIDKSKLPGDKIPDGKEATTLPSGLSFYDLKEGTGDEAADGQSVQVHYTGWL